MLWAYGCIGSFHIQNQNSTTECAHKECGLHCYVNVRCSIKSELDALCETGRGHQTNLTSICWSACQNGPVYAWQTLTLTLDFLCWPTMANTIVFHSNQTHQSFAPHWVMYACNYVVQRVGVIILCFICCLSSSAQKLTRYYIYDLICWLTTAPEATHLKFTPEVSASAWGSARLPLAICVNMLNSCRTVHKTRLTILLNPPPYHHK